MDFVVVAAAAVFPPSTPFFLRVANKENLGFLALEFKDIIVRADRIFCMQWMSFLPNGWACVPELIFTFLFFNSFLRSFH